MKKYRFTKTEEGFIYLQKKQSKLSKIKKEVYRLSIKLKYLKEHIKRALYKLIKKEYIIYYKLNNNNKGSK